MTAAVFLASTQAHPQGSLTVTMASTSSERTRKNSISRLKDTESPKLGLNLRSSPRNSPVGSPSSPLATTLSPYSDKFSTSTSDQKLKGKPKKTTCPCGMTSEGKDWKLKCITCKQQWHTSCANMKGANQLSQAQVDLILKHWQCPWCFTCAFPQPDK